MKFKKKILATMVAMTLGATVAKADITDGKFGTGQMFDVQYYWSQAETPTTPDYGCYSTNNCEVLNASGFTRVYSSSGQLSAQDYTNMQTNGQYFKFFNSTTPGEYGLAIYNSDGTVSRVLHNNGTITAIGPDAIFYLGSGFYGTVISTTTGYSFNSSATFTGMDTTVSSADLTSYSYATTTPLAAGQTASSPPPTPSGPVYVAVTQPTVVSVTPTSTNSPPGETAENAIDGSPYTKYLNFDRANAGFTIKLQSAQVLQGIKFTTANDFPDRDPTKYSLYGSNDGVNWTTIVNAASITLSDSRYTQSSMYSITNTNPYFYYFITFPDIKASANYADLNACGLACDSVQIGDVEFIYDSTFVFTAPTDTGTGVIANPGTAGSVSDMPTPVVGPQPVVNASGSTGTNASGATVTTVDNAGTYTNDGTTGNVTNSGTFTNNGTTSDVTNSGTFNNNGTTGDVSNSGTFNNNGTTGNVNNQGIFNNNGTVGNLTNTGTFYNNQGGLVNSIVYNNHWIENSGTVNSVTYNGGTIVNNSTGVIGIINNTEEHGTFHNDGTVTGTVTTNSTFNNNSTGVVQGLYTNDGILRNYGTLANVINTGTLTTYANSTTGDVTNSGTFTNNSGAIVGAITNSNYVLNHGTTGNVNNNGAFTSDGTVGNVVNQTFGTFNNNNIAGDVTNSGTFNNNGTAGAVTLNGGTFFNSGTAASVNNAAGLSLTNDGTITGTLSNTGTVASLTNNGTIGNVTGTITDVVNTGTMTNSGSVTTGNNSGWFTNAVNAVVSFFTNSGTATNNGTVTSVTNTGTYTNAGTTDDWNNSNVMTNTGTMGNGTNSGTYSNSSTVGNVTNTGTFNNSGNTGIVSNSGTFNYNGGTLGGYTQTAGITVMSMNQPIIITGIANLAGGLTINNAPTNYGRYTILSAGTVNGTYDPLSGSNYLKYALTDVKLYVTPNAAATQASIDATTRNLSNAINLQSNAVTGALGNDCAVFGSAGACVSVNVGQSKAASGDLLNGGITVAKKVNDNWRVGVTTNAPFNNPTIGNVSQTSDPAYGVFATWTKERLSIQGSAAFNQGTMTMTRQGPETGVGKMNVDNKAYQLRANYAMPVSETVTVTPYVGVRYVESNYSGFTEQGPEFPLTVNSTKRNQTSAIAGVSVAKQLTEKLSGNVSVGVTQNLTGQSATFTGTSEIGGLTTFNSSLPSNGRTNPSIGAGLSYSVDKTTKVGVNVGVQQKGDNANISSVGLTITKGF